MSIADLFQIETAKSHGTDDYDTGEVPFITNSRMNNGVVRFVEPMVGDKIFPAFTICISGLGFATLQPKSYLPKGNGGDSATILSPLVSMTFEELLFYTAQFNLAHGWRFSFGRKASKKRIQSLTFSRIFSDFALASTFSSRVKTTLSEKLQDLSLVVAPTSPSAADT